MLGIFRTRGPFQIRYPIIAMYSIFVIDLGLTIRIGNKGGRDDPATAQVMGSPILA
jgi:hypothetical protein